MREFFKKIKVVQEFSTEIDMPKYKFVEHLKRNVEPGSVSIGFRLGEMFKKTPHEFIGHVGFSQFEMRRMKRFMSFDPGFAVASGQIESYHDRTLITGEVNSFHRLLKGFYLMIILFYSFAIFMMATTPSGDDFSPLFITPFVFIHGLFMAAIPYFMMRKSTQKMVRELDREFYYMTKQ